MVIRIQTKLQHVTFKTSEVLYVNANVFWLLLKFLGMNTLKARFSGHRFSGKPRFKGHSLENMGTVFYF